MEQTDYEMDALTDAVFKDTAWCELCGAPEDCTTGEILIDAQLAQDPEGLPLKDRLILEGVGLFIEDRQRWQEERNVIFIKVGEYRLIHLLERLHAKSVFLCAQCAGAFGVYTRG